LIDLEPIKQAGFKVVVEPMWGNDANWFPRLLAGGKTQVIEVHNEQPIFPEMLVPSRSAERERGAEEDGRVSRCV
jgi:hypothetical protein